MGRLKRRYLGSAGSINAAFGQVLHVAIWLVAVVMGISSRSILADDAGQKAPLKFDIKAIEKDRMLKAADQFLTDEPITVTASQCPRSSGGPHDFFSEGDYWWPDPKNPDGPYIQRDGMTNPDNFVDHRHAMIRLSIHVGTLTTRLSDHRRQEVCRRSDQAHQGLVCRRADADESEFAVCPSDPWSIYRSWHRRHRHGAFDRGRSQCKYWSRRGC